METIKQELLSLSNELRKTGIYFRLIMSDDIKDLKDIRHRASQHANHIGPVNMGDDFFSGIAVRPDIQNRIDALVRNRKSELLALINADENDWDDASIEVVQDTVQQAFVIVFTECGAGFYVSESVRKPRHERTARKAPTKLGDRPTKPLRKQGSLRNL